MAASRAATSGQISDVGAIWEEALRKYRETAKIDLVADSKWNILSIMEEQARQVQLFSQYRHDKGKVDKLRSFLSRNSNIVQSLAEQVANAASSAFPPSTIILAVSTPREKAVLCCLRMC